MGDNTLPTDLPLRTPAASNPHHLVHNIHDFLFETVQQLRGVDVHSAVQQRRNVAQRGEKVLEKNLTKMKINVNQGDSPSLSALQSLSHAHRHLPRHLGFPQQIR